MYPLIINSSIVATYDALLSGIYKYAANLLTKDLGLSIPIATISATIYWLITHVSTASIAHAVSTYVTNAVDNIATLATATKLHSLKTVQQ